VSAVLVIENEKTFEEVIRRTDLSEHVLVLLGGGFLGEAEVALLRQVDVPIFAWGDLDPKAIQIVTNIADRVGRPVIPVLMTPELLMKSPTIKASDDSILLASALSTDGAGAFSALASAIAALRVTAEQGGPARSCARASRADRAQRLRWPSCRRKCRDERRWVSRKTGPLNRRPEAAELTANRLLRRTHTCRPPRASSRPAPLLIDESADSLKSGNVTDVLGVGNLVRSRSELGVAVLMP
jgi:hypothetical protein